MMHTSKNYKEQGGDTSVIGGTLEFLSGAKIKNFPGIANQTDSTATDVATIVADFNSLLAKLKEAGLMKKSN